MRGRTTASGGEARDLRERVWAVVAYAREVGRERVVRWVSNSTGVTLPYLEQGDPSGMAILLLHPWGESLRCFGRLMSLLPPSLHVLAMDQRGHGDADKPVGGYELASFAADVQAFLGAVDLVSAVLVGSSSGGCIAQQVALDSPSRVTGLVLLGSPRSLHGRRPEFAQERLSDPVDPACVRESPPRLHVISGRCGSPVNRVAGCCCRLNGCRT
jgi:pimeloyl-ACP methyl ester carboxylesterase